MGGHSKKCNAIRTLKCSYLSSVMYIFSHIDNSFVLCDAVYYAVLQVDSTLLNVLVQQQAEMKEQLRVHTRYLQEILNRQKGLDDAKAGRLPECMKLPLKSYSDIMQMEQSVITESNRRQLVSKFIELVANVL
jgi:Tfp pilus assembly PilM family ATPase